MIKKLKFKYRSMPVQVKASMWFLICSFLQRGISVITTPIFTRLLNTAEYGQYNVFNSWLGIIAIFVTFRLSYGVYSQGLVKFEDDRPVFSSSMQGLNLTLCLLWSIAYTLGHNFWNSVFHLSTTQMASLLVMVWATAVFEFWATEQRVVFSYKKLVLVTILVSVAKPLLGIVLVIHAQDKVTARILGLAIVELIFYTGFFFIQLIRGKKFFSKTYWTYAIGFNLPLIPHYLSQTVLNNSDRIMIENMIGASEAGIYSLAYSLATLMILVSSSLSNTISPWIYQKIKQNKVDSIGSVAYISLIIMAAVNILLIAFAPEAVAIFAPPSYYDAIWVIPPVAMSVYFLFCYDLFAKFEFYYEKTNYIMIASVAGALLNIILNYIFIKIFGYFAAGYTTLLCYIVYVIFHYYFMKKILYKYYGGNYVYDMKTILTISLSFVGVGFLYLLSYHSNIARYLFTVFLVLICLMKRNYIKEKLNIILSIRNKKDDVG